MKTVFLAIALAFIGLPSIAQNAAISDAIDSDSTFSPKNHITQIPLENCYRIDTCEEKRFAIVLKDAKCGIYDLQRHENVTNIEYDVLSFLADRSLTTIRKSSISMPKKALSKVSSGSMATTTKHSAFGMTTLNTWETYLNAPPSTLPSPRNASAYYKRE